MRCASPSTFSGSLYPSSSCINFWSSPRQPKIPALTPRTCPTSPSITALRIRHSKQCQSSSTTSHMMRYLAPSTEPSGGTTSREPFPPPPYTSSSSLPLPRLRIQLNSVSSVMELRLISTKSEYSSMTLLGQMASKLTLKI